MAPSTSGCTADRGWRGRGANYARLRPLPCLQSCQFPCQQSCLPWKAPSKAPQTGKSSKFRSLVRADQHADFRDLVRADQEAVSWCEVVLVHVDQNHIARKVVAGPRGPAQALLLAHRPWSTWTRIKSRGGWSAWAPGASRRPRMGPDSEAASTIETSSFKGRRQESSPFGQTPHVLPTRPPGTGSAFRKWGQVPEFGPMPEIGTETPRRTPGARFVTLPSETPFVDLGPWMGTPVQSDDPPKYLRASRRNRR
jgi:hypothetical protein